SPITLGAGISICAIANWSYDTLTPEADMTITFDNLTELPLEVRLNASGVNVSYDQLAIAQIEIPAPSVIGDIVEDNSRQLS
ncbi:hypothetical protein ACT453_56455, partial [Bacillus sp. D-CC]